ncbi:Major facilitator superfamily domain-containing protein 6 [Exaiptasia diaphana]|nr:Major facilitator superfamily domain-containing protein 6 [Exaiptasia diaphana]
MTVGEKQEEKLQVENEPDNEHDEDESQSEENNQSCCTDYLANVNRERLLEKQRSTSGHGNARLIDHYIPWALGFFRSYEPEESVTFKEVPFPNFKTHPSPEPIADSSRLFVSLLSITVVGVMFASPTQCLADTATIQLLGKDTHEYGKQAMWGSVGYGLTAFVVGASVSGQKHYNPCSKEMNTNFIPCFYVFAVYMLCAIAVATRFQYQPSKGEGKCKPSILAGLKILKNFEYAFFMFVVFFCGTATGFIQTFLFWHLRELGGEQILFSLITITNSTAEVLTYLFSDRFLSHIGPFKVIYVGLVCYALRFFYYSYCSTPWLFLPIELIQGITTAAIWSSFVSYVGSKPGLASTLQGLVSGFYTGLGYATGGFMGGLMVHIFGSSTSFLVFGEISLIVLFMFIIVNNVRTPDNQPLPVTVLKQTKDYVPKTNNEN